MREKLELLERRRAESELGGGEARLQAQHEKGKLSARERLELLLDEGSFVELDRFVVHRSTDFGLESQKFYGDGVITGHGKIDGRLVELQASIGVAWTDTNCVPDALIARADHAMYQSKSTARGQVTVAT